MARRYAEGTKVPVTQSQGEILAMVEKRGATDYVSGTYGGRPFVAFMFKGLPIKLQAPPIPIDGKDRMQEARRQWRVLVLYVKAQLEAIDGKVIEPAAAFMPHLALPDGRTVGEAAEEDGLRHTIAKTLQIGMTPRLEGPDNPEADNA